MQWGKGAINAQLVKEINEHLRRALDGFFIKNGT
jgi:hypothetical protein